MEEKMCKCDSCGMTKMCEPGSACECGGTMKAMDEGGAEETAAPAAGGEASHDEGMGGGDMGGHEESGTTGGQQ